MSLIEMTYLQKIDCLHNSAVMELMRGLRNQLTELMTGLASHDLAPMSLGLSHSLSRYKLKFSPEKVRLQQHCIILSHRFCASFFDITAFDLPFSSICWLVFLFYFLRFFLPYMSNTVRN
jgi:hypothetical protein